MDQYIAIPNVYRNHKFTLSFLYVQSQILRRLLNLDESFFWGYFPTHNTNIISIDKYYS